MLSHRREPGEDDEIGLHKNYGIIQKMTNEGTREKEVPRSYFSLLVSNRPFRIYLCSYLITIIGEWLTYVASIELVERLLGSESESSRMYISFLVVCRLIPHFILIPISGTLADARDKRKSMIMLDAVGAIAPLFYLFALYFKSIPIIYIVTLLQATIAAMYEPCRSSILPLMVKDDEDMKKATTLAELTWSAMTAIGSGLGGVLVAHIGIQACFLLDSVSFFASALLLYSIGGTWYIPDANEKLHVTVCGQIEDMAINGMKYVINNPFWPIVLIKISLCLVYGGSDPLNVAFVENYPNTSGAEQSQMFGALLFSTGFGCLVGPIIAEPFTSIKEPRTLLNSCALAFALQAVGDFALGYFISFEGKCVATLIRAAGSSIAWINSRVLLQVLVKPEMLGRVTAIDFGFGLAAEAFSAIVTGLLLDKFGYTPDHVAFLMGYLALLFFAIWSCYCVFGSSSALQTTYSYTNVNISQEKSNKEKTETTELLA